MARLDLQRDVTYLERRVLRLWDDPEEPSLASIGRTLGMDRHTVGVVVARAFAAGRTTRAVLARGAVVRKHRRALSRAVAGHRST